MSNPNAGLPASQARQYWCCTDPKNNGAVLVRSTDHLHDIVCEVIQSNRNHSAIERANLIAAAPCMLAECREAFVAIDDLLHKKPQMAGYTCGNTTLGNLRANLLSIVRKAQGASI